jgi:hypothetical protein
LILPPLVVWAWEGMVVSTINVALVLGKVAEESGKIKTLVIETVL